MSFSTVYLSSAKRKVDMYLFRLMTVVSDSLCSQKVMIYILRFDEVLYEFLENVKNNEDHRHQIVNDNWKI
jgi:hypothetical protein